jgi:hypothetical protein
MYNGKPAIAAALSTDAALILLIPKIRMFDGTAIFTGTPSYPYLTYDEINNGEGQHADDEEAESEVTFRIHLWGQASLSTIAGHVNRIMHVIGYGRNYAMDQDEQLDTGTTIKHKIMSFSGTFTA